MKQIFQETRFANLSHGGEGNGYVLIPQGHVFFGKSYDDIDVNVHGGLTFAELVDEELVPMYSELSHDDIGFWMVGFDTCHFGDNSQNWNEKNVRDETSELAKQILSASVL
jgi:hypothetical protein